MNQKPIYALLALAFLAVASCKKETPPPAEAPRTDAVIKVDKLPSEMHAATPVTDAGAGAEAAPPAEAGATGEITGTVAFNGAPPEMQPLKTGADPICAKSQLTEETVLVKDGMLANVVVRISKNAPAGPLPTEQVVLDQNGCQYRPHVVALAKGQPLAIKNSDGTMHNVHTYEGTKTWFNQAQPPKTPDLIKQRDAAGVVRFKCDVHPWMSAYAVFADNAFFTVTGADGKFTLPKVPAGTYTLEAWHEKLGVKTQEVSVAAGPPAAQVTFTYAADDRG
jgi:plastocyanin